MITSVVGRDAAVRLSDGVFGVLRVRPAGLSLASPGPLCRSGGEVGQGAGEGVLPGSLVAPYPGPYAERDQHGSGATCRVRPGATGGHGGGRGVGGPPSDCAIGFDTSVSMATVDGV